MPPNSSHNSRVSRWAREAGLIASGPLMRHAARWTREAQVLAARRRILGVPVLTDRVFLRPRVGGAARRLSIDARVELRVSVDRGMVDHVIRRLPTRRPRGTSGSQPTLLSAWTGARLESIAAAPPARKRSAGASSIVNVDQHVHTHIRRRLGSITQTLDRVDAIVSRALVERRVVERAESLAASRETSIVFGRRLARRAERQEARTAVVQILPAAPRRSARVADLHDDVTVAVARQTAAFAQPPRAQALPADVAGSPIT